VGGFLQAMKSEEPLLAAWDETLSQKNDQPAIVGSAGQIARTFRQIEEQARRFEAKIEPFDAGEVIAVQIGNHEDWPSIFVACLRRRLVILPLEQSISDQQRDAALEICKATAVVSASSAGLPAEALAEAGALAKEDVLSGTAPKISRLRTADVTTDWVENRPSLLKLTSGTTAAPRAIRFRSHQLLADCNQICDTMEILDVDLNFGVVPISHSYGFSNLLTPLIARGVPMIVSRDRTPRAVLADLARTGASVFPGMPLFYQAFSEMDDIPALPKLRLCISAGAPLPVSVAKKFRAKFGLPIHSFYGASECGGICYDRDARNEVEGFVGEPMKGVDVELVDPTAPASQILVHSAAVGDGYFPEPDEEKLGGGIFVPDDLLARNGSGFRIVGRISDVINVAGKKVNPAEVEAHLLCFRGVRQAVVFGRSAGAGLRNEEVIACVVASSQVSENELLRFCRTGLSPWQVPKQIFIMDPIPTNERGKISRRDLARRFSTAGDSSPLRRLRS
jgi:acyl-CoA synthetase (AMP-forming)/AMP-acid ligase II